MAFRKRGYRKFNKKPRTYRKRFSRAGSKRSSKRGILTHFFKRTAVTRVNVQIAGGFGTLGANQFTLASLPNYTEFTALYDTYKICGIRMKIVFNKDSSDVMSSNGLPQLITVNDFNDASGLTSEAEALQYASFKQRRMNAPISRYFRPTQLASGTTATDFQFVKSRWNSTINTGVPHLGMKMAITSPSTATLGEVVIYTTYYIACRSPK